jgi:hypothetical protein
MNLDHTLLLFTFSDGKFFQLKCCMHFMFPMNSTYPTHRHVCKITSICPHETSFPLDGFSWNFIFEYFLKICQENSIFIKNLTWITDTLHEDQYTFMISLPVLLRMSNVSNESCRKNQNTHFVFSNFLPKIVPFMRQCEKNMAQPGRPQTTIWRMRIACWVTKATNTLRI